MTKEKEGDMLKKGGGCVYYVGSVLIENMLYMDNKGLACSGVGSSKGQVKKVC